MLFMSVDAFFREAKACRNMSREEERLCAKAMTEQADAAARERLVQSYLPMVAAVIERAPASVQSLSLVVACCQTLEREIERFDFLQDCEPFSHRLSQCLRQVIVKHIADRI